MDQGTHSTVLAGNANLASALCLRRDQVSILVAIQPCKITHHLEGFVVGGVEYGGVLATGT